MPLRGSGFESLPIRQIPPILRCGAIFSAMGTHSPPIAAWMSTSNANFACDADLSVLAEADQSSVAQSGKVRRLAHNF